MRGNLNMFISELADTYAKRTVINQINKDPVYNAIKQYKKDSKKVEDTKINEIYKILENIQ